MAASDFWSLTPGQYRAHMKGAADRIEREDNQRRWHTWHGAALRRVKTLPKFDDFVRPPAQREQAPKQDMQSLIMSVRAWHHHLKD